MISRLTNSWSSAKSEAASPSGAVPKDYRHSVLHIEDDSFWSELVAKAIGYTPEFRLVGTVPTGKGGIARCAELFPQIVILDLCLPDLDGLEVIKILRAQVRPPRVLFMSVRNDDVVLHRTSHAEVAGMIYKGTNFNNELQLALKVVASGGRYVSRAVQADAQRFRAAPNAFFKLLTPREVEMLGLIAAGCPNHEIAALLGIGLEAIHSHRQHIMRKVDVHCAAKLVIWARETGFGR